jgi:hypothetical protein
VTAYDISTTGTIEVFVILIAIIVLGSASVEVSEFPLAVGNELVL